MDIPQKKLTFFLALSGDATVYSREVLDTICFIVKTFKQNKRLWNKLEVCAQNA